MKLRRLLIHILLPLVLLKTVSAQDPPEGPAPAPADSETPAPAAGAADADSTAPAPAAADADAGTTAAAAADAESPAPAAGDAETTAAAASGEPGSATEPSAGETKDPNATEANANGNETIKPGATEQMTTVEGLDSASEPAETTIGSDAESETTEPPSTPYDMEELEELVTENGGHPFERPKRHMPGSRHVKAHDGFHNVKNEKLWAHWNDGFNHDADTIEGQ